MFKHPKLISALPIMLFSGSLLNVLVAPNAYSDNQGLAEFTSENKHFNYKTREFHHQKLPKVLDDVTVGAYPRSVKVDDKLNKIYTVSPLDGNLTVVDGKTDKLTGSVFSGTDTNWSVVDEKNHKMYVASAGDAAIVTIDTKTDQVIGTPISVGSPHLPLGCNNITINCTDQGSDSYHIALNSKTGMLYVGNIGDQTIVVVDIKTGKLVGAPIALGTEPYFIAVNEKTNKIYTVTGFDATLLVIDGKTNKVTKTIPVGTAASPDNCYNTGDCTVWGSYSNYLVVNEETHRIYVGNFIDKSVVALDAKTDQIIGSPLSGVGSEIALNKKSNLLYVVNYYNDTLSVVDGYTNQVIGSPVLAGVPASPAGCEGFKTPCTDFGSGAFDVAFNDETNKIYVLRQNDNVLTVLDAETLKAAKND